MQNTPAIDALIHDIVKIADKEGQFETSLTPVDATDPKESAGWGGFLKASAKHIQKKIDAAHEYVTEHKKKEHELEIKQKKDTFKTEVKTVLEKIDNGQKITNGAEIKIYRMICQSETLGKIEKEKIQKIINNIPSKVIPFQALVENPALGKNLEYYPQIKVRILQSTLKQEEKATVLEGFDKNPKRDEAQSYQDPNILKVRMLEHAIFLAQGDEDNKYLPLFELWKQDKAENGGIKTAWSYVYDLDLKNTRSTIQNIIHTKFNVADKIAIRKQPLGSSLAEVEQFLDDLKGFSYALQVIDHKSGGSIDNKMADAIEYCSIYPKIVKNKEGQLNRKYDIAYKKYTKELPETIRKRDQAKAKYDTYKAEHDSKKALGQAVNDLLLGKYKSDLDTLEAQIEAHLPEKYHSSEFTKQAVKMGSRFAVGVPLGAASYVATPLVGVAATTAGAYAQSVAGATAGAAATAGVKMAGNALLQNSIANATSNLSDRIAQWQKERLLKNNVSQAMENDDFSTASTTTASFNGAAQYPDPQSPTKVSDTERNSEIAKIETPFERIAGVLEGISEENLKTVDNKVLSKLFEITFDLAIDDKISIDKRFAPFVKLMETMPNQKFKFDNQSILDNGNGNTAPPTDNQETFLSEERLFVVTDLIKQTLELNRGDYANSLINSFFKKLSMIHPEVLSTQNTVGSAMRQRISDITEAALILSNKHYFDNATVQKAPMASLLNLLGDRYILERNSIVGQKDIPVIGHLPELVAIALRDLNNGGIPTTQHLLTLATEKFAVRTPEVIVQGTQIFNGEDKTFLAEMIDKAETISNENYHAKLRNGALMNPNPLDKMLANFLDQYQAGHFAQGGGFYDNHSEGEGEYQILPRLVELGEMQKVETNNTQTYLHHLQDKPFKQIYDACNNAQDRAVAMQERFNRATPIKFRKTITPDMSKQRVAQASYASNTGVPSSIGGVGI